MLVKPTRRMCGCRIHSVAMYQIPSLCGSGVFLPLTQPLELSVCFPLLAASLQCLRSTPAIRFPGLRADYYLLMAQNTRRPCSIYIEGQCGRWQNALLTSSLQPSPLAPAVAPLPNVDGSRGGRTMRIGVIRRSVS